MRKVLVSLAVAGTVTLSMADGATIFKTCAVCHGEHAHKKSLGVSAVIAGWKPEKIVERLKAYRAGTLDQYGFGNMMGGKASKLSDAEMQEVAEYISKLKPVKVVVDPNKQITKGLPPEKQAYHDFLDNYFQENPNGTFKEALKLWEKKKKALGY